MKRKTKSTCLPHLKIEWRSTCMLLNLGHEQPLKLQQKPLQSFTTQLVGRCFVDPPENFPLTSFLFAGFTPLEVSSVKDYSTYKALLAVSKSTGCAQDYMQCMVAMSRVDNAMLSAQFEFVQAKSNGGGENRACTQCFIILHAPTFVWHAWCPSQIRRALEELKGFDYFQSRLQTTWPFQPIKSQSLGIRERFLTPAIPMGQHNASKESKKSQKSETHAFWTEKKKCGLTGVQLIASEFQVTFRESFMFPSLPQPSRMQRERRLIPSEVCRLYLDEPCRRIGSHDGMPGNDLNIALCWNHWNKKCQHPNWNTVEPLELLVVCLHKLYHDPAVVLCYTSGSPHPEGPWGCDASYCLKQLQSIQSNPWSTDGLIGFF